MAVSPDAINAIIVGAGPAGLACAVTMRAVGLNVTLLEKAGNVGSTWRHHYDRLHLHTDRGRSGLPGMAMPPSYPTYPSRAQMVEYLESYAARFDIRPVFNTAVSRVRCDGRQWCADAAQGSIAAPIMVVATGIAAAPYRPSWQGFEAHRGQVVHSSEYRNPAAIRGQAPAGVRIWQFGRRDRAGSGRRRRRCHACGSQRGSDSAARPLGLSDPGLG